MEKITGKYAQAKIFADDAEDYAKAQIEMICNNEVSDGCIVRIMPDVHPGQAGPIGLTMTVGRRIIPQLLGIDIGCGIVCIQLREKRMELQKLDKVIRERIPSGFKIRQKSHHRAEAFELQELRCFKHVSREKAVLSLGTLGGGNHFIEADRSDTGDIYIVVHSGSRHLGVEVADYYQEQGRMALWGGARYQIGQLIETLKSEGRFQEIQPAVTALKKEHKISIPKDLAYVEGKLFEDYIHDMRIVQHFAVLNRKAMMDVILSGMGFTKADEFTTIHNYIDTDAMVLRKGSVSAKKGEKLLIPINMRDGSLICIGKGNPEWNCSAPHGAGRLMSRRAAFSTLSMEQYRKEMKGIYSTCVVPDTLDESPMAYKSMEEIIAQIEPTAQIAERVKPVYNFKAAE